MEAESKVSHCPVKLTQVSTAVNAASEPVTPGPWGVGFFCALRARGGPSHHYCVQTCTHHQIYLFIFICALMYSSVYTYMNICKNAFTMRVNMNGFMYIQYMCRYMSFSVYITI